MPLHHWPHCLSLKSKWLPRYCNRSFQMPCKAFFCGQSPKITLRLGKCLIKVRIHCLLYLNLAFFYELCVFPQMVRSDAIWGQLCKIAPSRNISWPAKSAFEKYEPRGLFSEFYGTVYQWGLISTTTLNQTYTFTQYRGPQGGLKSQG